MKWFKTSSKNVFVSIICGVFSGVSGFLSSRSLFKMLSFSLSIVKIDAGLLCT